MTDEMMNLRALLEKSSDADLLREMIGFTAQRLMELEVEGLTGASHGERSAERITAGRNAVHVGLLHHRRQRLTSVALAEIRVRVPECLRDRQRSKTGIGRP